MCELLISMLDNEDKVAYSIMKMFFKSETGVPSQMLKIKNCFIANSTRFLKKNNRLKNSLIILALVSFVFVSPSLSLIAQEKPNPEICNNRQENLNLFNIPIPIINTLVSIFNAIIIASSLSFGFYTFKDESKWNRKKSAFEYLNSITLGEFIDIRNQLEQIDINPYRKETNYFTDRKKIKNEKINKTHLIRDILNAFDLICTGINHKVIDEQMAFDQLHIIMFAYWEWSKPYILLAKMLSVHSTDENKYEEQKVYFDFESQVYKWQKKERKTLKEEDEWKKEWKEKEIKLCENSKEENKTIREWAKIIYEKEYGFAKNLVNGQK